MECFCFDKLEDDGIQDTIDFKFSDGDQHCRTWLLLYRGSSLLIWIMVFVINIVNIMLKFFLRKFIKYERKHDKTEEVVSTTFLLFFVTYFNTAVILFMVNINFDLNLPEWFPILAGEYDDLTVEWYRNVGSSIIMTMIIGIFSPHIANSFWWILGFAKRLWDRKCTCDYKRTRQVFQIDYEMKYIGADYLMEYRYS